MPYSTQTGVLVPGTVIYHQSRSETRESLAPVLLGGLGLLLAVGLLVIWGRTAAKRAGERARRREREHARSAKRDKGHAGT